MSATGHDAEPTARGAASYVSLMGKTEIAVLADRFGRPEWRVEYSADGACYVTIFAGLDAERRARNYHAALETGALQPICPGR